MKAYDLLRLVISVTASLLVTNSGDKAALAKAQADAAKALADDATDKTKIETLTSERTALETKLALHAGDSTKIADLEADIAALNTRLADIGDPLTDAEKAQLAQLLEDAHAATPAEPFVGDTAVS